MFLSIMMTDAHTAVELSFDNLGLYLRFTLTLLALGQSHWENIECSLAMYS